LRRRGYVEHNIEMKSLAILFTTATLLLVAIPKVHAADTCSFNSESAALKKAQDTGALSLNDELVLRKNFLKKVVGCAITETKDLQNKLQKAPSADADISRVKTQLDGQLNQAVSYYNLRAQEIGDLGIYGTVSLAQNIREWRKNVYVPLAQKVSNLFLWISNQTLFENADSRFRQVGQLVKDKNLLVLVDVQSIFDQAQISFHKAQVANDNAKRSLDTSVSSDDSLSLIMTSLSALSDTYAQFFNLSNAVSYANK
jgi:hypothetical protein